MKAIWKDQVIAEGDDTVVVDGTHYFRPADVRQELLEASDTRTTCGWKGQASYYHIVVGGERNADAVWTYPDPKPAAEEIRGRLAFWKGVRTVE